LEGTVKSVREKYKALLRDAADVVQAEHNELDHSEIHAVSDDVVLGIGKSGWGTRKGYWQSGLWLGGIWIDNLMSDDEDPPYVCVFVNHPTLAIDLESSGRILFAAARRILPAGDFRRVECGASGGLASISYHLSLGRRDLLGLLCGDGNGFVNRLAAEMRLLVKFVPALDKIFRLGRRKNR
jgi:hypothetical protein